MSPYVKTFVMHVGEMGSRWGLNRTLGQMCGLLYVSVQPLNADEIAQALSISRSNVSMGLKELKAWRLVRPATISGDRREYWTTPKEVWELFQVLAEERHRREVQPTLSMLRESLMIEPTNDDDRYAQERLREMHELIELLTGWIEELQDQPPRTLVRLLKLGRRIQNLLDKRRKNRNSNPPTNL